MLAAHAHKSCRCYFWTVNLDRTFLTVFSFKTNETIRHIQWYHHFVEKYCWVTETRLTIAKSYVD